MLNRLRWSKQKHGRSRKVVEAGFDVDTSSFFALSSSHENPLNPPLREGEVRKRISPPLFLKGGDRGVCLKLAAER